MYKRRIDLKHKVVGHDLILTRCSWMSSIISFICKCSWLIFLEFYLGFSMGAQFVLVLLVLVIPFKIILWVLANYPFLKVLIILLIAHELSPWYFLELQEIWKIEILWVSYPDVEVDLGLVHCLWLQVATKVLCCLAVGDGASSWLVKSYQNNNNNKENNKRYLFLRAFPSI